MKTIMLFKTNDFQDFSKHPFHVECYEIRSKYPNCNRVYYRVTHLQSQRKYYVMVEYLHVEDEIARNIQVDYRVVSRSHWNARSYSGDRDYWRLYRQPQTECEFHDAYAVLAAVSSFIRTRQLVYRGGPFNPRYRFQSE